MKLNNWEKITEMLRNLKDKPYKIEVYEGTDYFKVEFYFEGDLK